eukprot:327142_1
MYIINTRSLLLILLSVHFTRLSSLTFNEPFYTIVAEIASDACNTDYAYTTGYLKPYIHISIGVECRTLYATYDTVKTAFSVQTDTCGLNCPISWRPVSQYSVQIQNSVYKASGIRLQVYDLTQPLTPFTALKDSIGKNVKFPQPMEQDTMCLAATRDNRYIIGIGGAVYLDGSPTPVVQIYDLLAETWTVAQDLPVNKWGAGCVVHPSNNMLYVIGGWTNFNDYSDIYYGLFVDDMQNIGMYNWETYIHNTFKLDHYGRLIAYDEYLIVLGGYDDAKNSGGIVVLDITKKPPKAYWETVGIGGLRIEWGNAAVQLVNDRIYIFGDGGTNNWHYIDLLLVTTTTTTKQPTTKQPTKKPTKPPTTKSPTKPPTTKKPTKHPTSIPTKFPTNNPSLTPTKNPTKSPSFAPSITPSFAPSISPSTAPSFSPSSTPSLNPSLSPSINPSITPSLSPSLYPTNAPSLNPTISPSLSPSDTPSLSPSIAPSLAPSISPTSSPILPPTISPSFAPTIAPSLNPSLTPSLTPSIIPSLAPSTAPTLAPSLTPSITPSLAPSITPTLTPSITPSLAPSLSPTLTPSIVPSLSPTLTPTTPPTLAPSLAPSSSPTPTCHHAKYKQKMIKSTLLNINNVLYGGESFVSVNCRFLLTMNRNGNLLLSGIVGKYQDPFEKDELGKYTNNQNPMIFYNGWKANTFIR